MKKDKLLNEIMDDELKAEQELRKESELFQEKILGLHDKEIEKSADLDAKLTQSVEDHLEKEFKDNDHYETLKVKSMQLEEELRDAETKEKKRRLELYQQEAAKQSIVSERELKKAEELIKKSFFIKEARDKLNAMIEEKRMISKEKQISYSSRVIDQIDSSKRNTALETKRIMDRIQVQKEYVKVRHAQDRRLAFENAKKVEQRKAELTQTINLIQEKKRSVSEFQSSSSVIRFSADNNKVERKTNGKRKAK